MTRTELDALARRYLSASFASIEARLSEPLEQAGHAQVVELLQDRASDVSVYLAHADYRHGIKRARSLLPAGSDAETQRKLARRLLEADLEAARAALAVLDGEPLVFPSLVSGGGVPAAESADSPSFATAAEMYAADAMARGAWTPHTEAKNRAALGFIGEVLGHPQHIGDVSKADIRAFAQTMPKVPTNCRKNWPGMNIADVLAKIGDDVKVPRLAPRSVNEYHKYLHALFNWAIKNDVVTSNPTAVLRKVVQPRGKDQRKSFTDDQLAGFLARVDATAKRAPVLRWAVPVLALSGMRLGEYVQLRKQDIREVEGIPCFDINAEDGKTVKTEASVRLVPVHPRLIARGFLDFVAKQTDGYLWPAHWRTARVATGSMSDVLSAWLMRRLRAAGVEDPKLVVHSLRHTVSTRLKAQGIPAYQIDELQGHAVQGMSVGVYGDVTPLQALLGVLGKLVLPI